VQVTSVDGTPGSPVSVRVRGVGTVGNAQPLFVVDGVPVGNNESGRFNPLATINPADIGRGLQELIADQYPIGCEVMIKESHQTKGNKKKLPRWKFTIEDANPEESLGTVKKECESQLPDDIATADAEALLARFFPSEPPAATTAA
jgi:hypothetical protein